jgi:DNA-binding CsgD family transcriptional regulator
MTAQISNSERPMKALMAAGFSPDESSNALDRSEETLGF